MCFLFIRRFIRGDGHRDRADVDIMALSCLAGTNPLNSRTSCPGNYSISSSFFYTLKFSSFGRPIRVKSWVFYRHPSFYIIVLSHQIETIESKKRGRMGKENMIRFVDSVVQYRSILSNALFLFYHHRVSFSISTNKAFRSSILSIFKSLSFSFFIYLFILSSLNRSRFAKWNSTVTHH